MESLVRYIKHPSFAALLLGLVIGGMILAVSYNWAEQKKQSQLAKIKEIELKIEATRPPANDPQTDWQRAMTELAQKQKFFWGRQIIQYASLLPPQIQLKSIAVLDDAFESTGTIYSRSLDLRLTGLGNYTLNCIDNKLLKENLGPWQIRKLVRTTPEDVNFTLHAAIQ
jgi:hypothetical protein